MDSNINNPAYEEGKVYQAKIIDQMVAKNQKEETQIILTVQVLAKLKNDKNVWDGTEECPQLEREVRITIVENDYERLRIAINHLERLGYTNDDIGPLHPEHQSFFSLIGRQVHVRMKRDDEFEYWNFAWPREKPKPVSLGDLTKGASSLSAKIAATKQRIKEERASKTGRATNPAPETEKHPEVGY